MNKFPQPHTSVSGGLSLRTQWGCAGALLLLHLLICLHTAFSKTVTHDEIWHLPVGARNLGEWRFDVERLNPPLTRMWAAVPLVLSGVEINQEVQEQGVGRQFVADHPEDFNSWYRWGRTFNVLWTLGTALLTFLWARRWFGAAAGLLALLFYVTCPNITAHASVVTPDSGQVFAFVSTLFALSCWCERPGWGRAVLWGVLLGLAQAIKFTSLLLYPLAFAIAIIQLWPTNRRPTLKHRELALQFTAAIIISMLSLWACYGFQGILLPLSSYHFQSVDLVSIQKLFSSISFFPVPLPKDYLLGLDEQRFIMSGAHAVFMDGEWSLNGFRTYFLKALFYKTPHIFQLMLITALIAGITRRYPLLTWKHAFTLLAPGAILLAVASGEHVQLGIRYINGILPLLMIFAAGLINILQSLSTRIQHRVITIITITCLLSLRTHPNHLAYFNELAGGTSGGRAHLVDSNLDWGQDLHQVWQYMQEQGTDSVRLAYFGTVPPQALGIQFELPPSRAPEPGVYAVSVNFVMGRPHAIPEGNGNYRSADFGEFSYFRFFQPLKTFGGSIDLYEISEADVDEWKAALRQ